MLVGKCCDVLKWAAVEVDVWVGVVNNFKLGFVISVGYLGYKVEHPKVFSVGRCMSWLCYT